MYVSIKRGVFRIDHCDEMTGLQLGISDATLEMEKSTRESDY